MTEQQTKQPSMKQIKHIIQEKINQGKNVYTAHSLEIVQLILSESRKFVTNAKKN